MERFEPVSESQSRGLGGEIFNCPFHIAYLLDPARFLGLDICLRVHP